MEFLENDEKFGIIPKRRLIFFGNLKKIGKIFIVFFFKLRQSEANYDGDRGI